MKNQIIKTCANCKHFKIIKQGYEIKKLIDSAYLISRCKVKGWEIKEYYLAPDSLKSEIKKPKECELWEEMMPFWKTFKKIRRKDNDSRNVC